MTLTDEQIETLRDALNGDRILSSTERDALLAEVLAGRAEIARLEADYNELTEAYAELLINGRTEAEMREAARAGMQAFHKRRAALKGE